MAGPAMAERTRKVEGQREQLRRVIEDLAWVVDAITGHLDLEREQEQELILELDARCKQAGVPCLWTNEASESYSRRAVIEFLRGALGDKLLKLRSVTYPLLDSELLTGAVAPAGHGGSREARRRARTA